MNDAAEQVTIPIIIAGLALLVSVGFFTAARRWVQERVGSASSGPVDTPGGRGESGKDGSSSGGGAF